jgi:hypothetical protein
VTTSTPPSEVQARATELVRRIGNDLAELSVVIELADQHDLTLPESLYRMATALDIPAVPAEAERQQPAASGQAHRRLHRSLGMSRSGSASIGRGGEVA